MRRSHAAAMARPPPMANPSTTARVGTGRGFDAADVVLHLRLIGDAVLTAVEGLELRDIGARNEGLAAGAAKHRNAQPILAADARACFAELFVHSPGHGIARRRPVEDDRGDIAGTAVAHLSVTHGTSAVKSSPRHARDAPIFSRAGQSPVRAACAA